MGGRAVPDKKVPVRQQVLQSPQYHQSLLEGPLCRAQGHQAVELERYAFASVRERLWKSIFYGSGLEEVVQKINEQKPKASFESAADFMGGLWVHEF